MPAYSARALGWQALRNGMQGAYLLLLACLALLGCLALACKAGTNYAAKQLACQRAKPSKALAKPSQVHNVCHIHVHSK